MAGIDYDFAVCSSPNELRDQIVEKNKIRNKARLVAGYCWDWASKKDVNKKDIVFPKADFRARWNLTTDGSLWILMPESVSEIGCIHTCQGLELDYVGVLFGPDFIVRDGIIQTDATERSRMDSSVKGYKSLFKKNPQRARMLADEIIKNTYRTLMTRGQKGCYVYSVDPETNEFFKQAASRFEVVDIPHPREKYAGLPLRLLADSDVKPYINAVPVFDLQVR